MQNDQASRTALLIAASLVLLHRNPKYPGLVSKTSADMCAQMLETYSRRSRLFLKTIRQAWFRPLAKSIERITIPGILLHYGSRKKCIAGLARSALTDGATQVVIIGAGFDPLSFELHQDFPVAQFWEIDHPATQRHKVRELSMMGAERLRFIAMDLNANGFDTEGLIKSGFDPGQRTFWVAEGLLMYLPADTVAALMRRLRSLSAPGSQFAFTFREKQGDNRIRFDSQTKLVDWWLRRRGEPFLWACTRGELAELVRPWDIVRFYDHHDLRQIGSGPTDQPIAKGEVICLAEV